MSAATLVLALCIVSPIAANILLPHSIFATKSEGMVQQPVNYQDGNTDGASSDVYQQQHNRNCFFTPVQCMLPTSDSHKDVQSLHGVYSPTATVRRSVDAMPMITSPWGYTDLIKRSGDERFYQWLSRF